MLCSVNYDKSESSSDEEKASSEEKMSTYNRDSTVEVENFTHQLVILSLFTSAQ